jgi:hypothetical protein
VRLKPCVKRLELSVSLSLRRMRHASPAQARCRSISPGFCNMSQSTKTPFPSNPALAAGCAKSFSLPKRAQVFTSPGLSREVSSAISGFRSLCGRQRRSSLKPSRSIGPAFWNLSIGAGSRSENSGLHPQYPSGASTGPANPGPTLCAERSRSRRIFQVVFCTLIRLYGGNFSARDRPRDPRQIGFGRPLMR